MPPLATIGRWLLIAGLALAGIGGLLWLGSRLGLPLGRMPGDFSFEAKGFRCFVPLTTSLLLSILLTLALSLIARLLNK
ncbi:MAG: DUF2905 domain-containing protein [Anaerolineales bacterium]|jgi:hypothetical protein